MIRDITIGQYYPVESYIHKLDPRMKLLCTLGFIVSLFLTKSFWGGYLAALVFLTLVIRISHVPLKFMLKGLKSIFIIILLTVVLNVFFLPRASMWC